MQFRMPFFYSLIIKINFPEEQPPLNQQQIELTRTILTALASALQEKMPGLEVELNTRGKSLIITYFTPKEGSYRGAKKLLKQRLKKVKQIFIALERRYPISLNAILCHRLEDFFI